LPARSVQDDSLHPTTFRVLAAICLHTNGYGICFPCIAQAFRQGVERGSGVVRDVAASLECARRLAEKGIEAGKVLELAVQATIDNRKNRKDPPMTLDQVAKWGGLE
jgi:hypothetical protein